MSAERWVAYQFTVLRAVPHVHRGEFVNVGVVLHARTEGYLGIRAVDDPGRLRALLPDADVDLLARYLDCYRGICAGIADAGPIALLPTSERFHWMSAPRSDLLQSSPVHEGISLDPETTLLELYAELVRG